MTKFFGNLGLVVTAGAVLFLAVLFGVQGRWDSVFALRALHVLCGIMWIGHLYYFNFTQIPTMPKVPAELKAGVTRYIAPEALFWFRWGAAATVVTGLGVAQQSGYLAEALALESPFRTIGIGMWLALIMAFNVWVIIWPAQKQALGLVPAADAAKARAATRAMIFSRTNTLLSIAMLYCMISAESGF
ncbi:MAG: urate hydroxylase PuuD [Sphingomonadales bacterium]|nr:urate hydroxylase PuuD [Sphingomonadales bacterium]